MVIVHILPTNNECLRLRKKIQLTFEKIFLDNDKTLVITLFVVAIRIHSTSVIDFFTFDYMLKTKIISALLTIEKSLFKK